MEGSKKSRAIGAALAKALAFWALVYAVVIHAHVLWTWPEQAEPVPPPPRPSNEDVLAAKRERAAAAAAAAHLATEKKIRRRELEQKLQQESKRLSEELEETERRHVEWLESTKQKLSLLQHNIHRLASQKVPQQERVPVELPMLQSLLSTSSLDKLGDEELLVALQEAVDEIDEVIIRHDEIAWDGWDDVLKSDYARDPPTPKKCKSDSAESNVSPDTARESDLFSQVQLVETALKQRKTGALPLSNESTERVLQAVKEAAIQQKRRIDEEASSTLESDTIGEVEGKCVNSDEVEWLVEEGLNALQRHKDLRGALQRALADVNPEAAEKVILDAVLLPPQPKKDKGVSSVVNLRQVLDTPLVSQKSPQWVDVAVDHLSGHNDFVDQTLDSILPEDNDSVGKVLVSKLLNLAGKVSFPNPYQNISTKAGILKP